MANLFIFFAILAFIQFSGCSNGYTGSREGDGTNEPVFLEAVDAMLSENIMVNVVNTDDRVSDNTNEPISLTAVHQLPPESEMLNVANNTKIAVARSPGNTVVAILPEEAEMALEEMMSTPGNERYRFVSDFAKELQREGRIYQSGWEVSGHWVQEETMESSEKRKKDKSLPRELAWRYNIIIAGWWCELTEGFFQQDFHHSSYLGRFEKDSDGKWIAKIISFSRHYP